MTTRITLAIALLLAAGSTPAFAQSAPPSSQGGGTVASATRLMGLLKIEGVLDTMFQQIAPLIASNVLSTAEKGPNAPAALKSRLADPKVRPDVERIMAEEVLKSYRARYPDLLAATARQYAATFSEADLTAAIAFYQSAAGQHFIAAQPRVQAAMSEEGRRIGMAVAETAISAALARIAALPAPAQ